MGHFNNQWYGGHPHVSPRVATPLRRVLPVSWRRIVSLVFGSACDLLEARCSHPSPLIAHQYCRCSRGYGRTFRDGLTPTVIGSAGYMCCVDHKRMRATFC